MKILLIDKYFFVKGGAERYYFEIKDVLEANGHTVIPFSMKHPRNFPSDYSEYFVDEIDFNPKTKWGKAAVGLRSLGRILYSFEAQRKLRALIEKTQPDVAHLHMIDHQISPSILPVLKKARIPVMQTVHTYKHVCPSYRLYLMDKGRICEKCVGGNYCRALFEKCHKESFWATAILVAEMTLHKWLRLWDHVDLFHVPSLFMGRKLAQGGFDERKIHHLFYTININDYPIHIGGDDYFVYYGRLSEEKGIMTLLEAMKGVNEIRLKIIGEGPLEKALQTFVQENNLDNIAFAGYLDGDDLKQAVSRARFVVVPSEWYENSPLVIYESFSMAKPVIGARMGGIPELISHGEDGYLYDAGDTDSLRHWIVQLAKDQGASEGMGRAARQKAEKLFHPEKHYQKLMALYQSMMR